MSIQFSDPDNKNGIVQLIDRNCKTNASSYPLADKAADANIAMDEALSIIFTAAGRWQYDDSNHTDYPIIMTNIVSGQRDYSFTTDEQGNLILDIYKVMRKNRDGIYEEILPRDMQSDEGTESFWDNQNVTGIPNYYDKTANGIFFDVIPDFDSVNGIKIFINRESVYFNAADTAKKPGFAGIFHEYIALRPSYQYAFRNGLANKNDLAKELKKVGDAMKHWYRDRSKDEQHLKIMPERINCI